MKNTKISSDTVARTIFLAITLMNSILLQLGKTPLDLDENTIYVACSVFAQIISAVLALWKNNSFSKEAIAADKFLNDLRTGDKDDHENNVQ